MSKLRAAKYFYRAWFKPNSLDAFDGFSVGFNDNGRGLGYAQVWHRCNVDYSPYTVFSEYICGEIGRFLRLPIPPFAITKHREGKKTTYLFSSLDFNYQRAKLTPIIPELCVKTLAPLCAGVLAFDIFIANEDRHDENLLVDRVSAPREMHVFDHDQALLGGAAADGADKLKKLRDRLGITGSTTTGGNRHVFLDQVTTCGDLFAWIDRIRDIPDWFIEDICQEARRYGLSAKLARSATDFLLHRKQCIYSIIDSNREEFQIGDWPDQKRFF